MAKRTSSPRRPRQTPRPAARRASKRRAPKRRASKHSASKGRTPKRRTPTAVRARKSRRAQRAVRPAARRSGKPRKALKKSRATERRPTPRRAGATTHPSVSQPHDHPPTLLRERRRLPDEERVDTSRIDSRLVAEARSGHDAVAASLKRYHEDGPELTAGDIDAKWDDASAIGDETPGGDNPTPDQNEVDAIGRAVGAEYDDDEELMGGEEIGQRDAHRWELDPQSRDDADDDQG